MSHMPRFWREKSFKSWKPYLTEFLNHSNTTWTVDELVAYYCPNDPEEQARIKNAVRCALSELRSNGVIEMLRRKVEGSKMPRGHYGRISLACFTDVEAREIPVEVVISQWASTIIPEPDELVPRDEFYRELNAKRIEQIGTVLLYRIDRKKEIPLEWITEYNQLIK